MQQRRTILGPALAASLVSGLVLVTLLGLSASGDSPAVSIADFLLQIVAVVAAFAVLIGVVNLLVSVHLRRFLRFQRGWLYSLITVITAVAVVMVYAMDEGERWSGDLEGERLTPRLFQVIQITLESALAGLILFFLVYAVYRLMRKKVTWTYALFSAVVLVTLVGWIQLDGLEKLADFRDWVFNVPVLAGTRGLLIGIGLGTVVTGIRLLLAQERIYRRPPQL